MNYFKDIITNEEHFIDLPDCIATGQDYKETIEKSFKITNGLLQLDEFNWAKNNGRFEFDLTVNRKQVKFSVEIASDFVDSNGVIDGLNHILDEIGYEGDKRFCDLNGGVADFGVAFITREKEAELAKNDLIWRG